MGNIIEVRFVQLLMLMEGYELIWINDNKNGKNEQMMGYLISQCTKRYNDKYLGNEFEFLEGR